LLFLPGCTLAADYDECRIPGRCLAEDTATLCSDGVDNDLDGLRDCRDPGCSSYCQEDTDELCADDVDNDGNELIDCNDPHCSETDTCTENTDEKCGDGLDTDLDGDTDCDDDDCCAVSVCHNLELCAETLLSDDFEDGVIGEQWKTLEASSGYRVEENVVEEGGGALHIYSKAGCYSYTEETGVITREPFDLTRGRLYIDVDVSAAMHVNMYAIDVPLRLALIPHARSDTFVFTGGARNSPENRPCNYPEPISEVHDATPYETATLFDIFSDGRRRVSFRRGDTKVGFPSEDIAVAVPHQKETWQVRFDIDDEEIVFFEKTTGGWDELYRCSNELPGRKVHLAVLGSIDQIESDLEVWVDRIRVSQNTSSPQWETLYEHSFDTDPEWATNNESHCHFVEARSAMKAIWESMSEEYCYAVLPEPLGDRDWRLEYTFKVEEIDYAAYFRPGLLDAAASAAHGFHATIGLGHPMEGYCISQKLCSRTKDLDVNPDEVVGRWLTARMHHDASDDTIQAELFDPETEETLYWNLAEDVGCELEFHYFGLTAIDRDRYDHEQANGLIDQVTLKAKLP
jgi:hypothetical protein